MLRGLLVAGVCLSTSFASATAGAEGFALQWVRAPGAESCVDGSSLRAAVRAKLRLDPFAPSFSTIIEGIATPRAKGGFDVELFHRDSSGKPLGSRRLFTATQDCSALREAIVLAIVLAIDPTGRNRAVEHKPAPVEPAPRAPPGPIRSKAKSSTRRTLSVGPLLASNLLPDLSYGASLRIGSDISAKWSLRGGVSYQSEQKAGLGADEAAFGASTVSLGACVAPWSPATVAFDLCAELVAGAVHAVVFELLPLDVGERLWLATNLSIGAKVRLSPTVFLRVEASVFLPINRLRYSIQGDTMPIFQQSRVIPALFLGPELRFR